MVGRITRVLLASVALAVATATRVLAQAPTTAPEAGPDVFGNMPGAILLLIPILIGGAVYVSRKLGPQDDEASTHKREGAVSKALARKREKRS